MRILVTGARAPIAADLLRAFSLAGHKAWCTDSLLWPLSGASPYSQGYHRLAPPAQDFSGFTSGLAALCERLSIDAIVPTNEEVFWLAAASNYLPAETKLRTSALPLLLSLHDKYVFSQRALRLGYGAPENHLITAASDLGNLRDDRDWVLKPTLSRFATEILIKPTRRIRDNVSASPNRPWLAQSFVEGEEYCCYNVVEQGRLLLHSAYRPILRYGTGASVAFAPVERPDLRKLCEAFSLDTGFTGQLSFDVIDGPNGLVAIECNPRGTSGIHLWSEQPEALVDALLGKSREEAKPAAQSPTVLKLAAILSKPSLPFSPSGRELLAKGSDPSRRAGVSLFRLLLATSEISLQAWRRGVGLARASTLDFEWNSRVDSNLPDL